MSRKLDLPGSIYFPMQKVEKMSARMSSGVVAPVSESSARSAV